MIGNAVHLYEKPYANPFPHSIIITMFIIAKIQTSNNIQITARPHKMFIIICIETPPAPSLSPLSS